MPSSAHPGTQHTYWVYVPAQYDPNTPASLMIFNDGQAFKNPDGNIRAYNVLDNLVLKSSPEPGGSILDNSMIVYGAGLADGNSPRTTICRLSSRGAAETSSSPAAASCTARKRRCVICF